MIEGIERDRYLIPIPGESLETPTGQPFEQLQEIPVEHRVVKLPHNPPKYYLDFNLPPIFIFAGGETIEIAQQRIRCQVAYLYIEASRPSGDPLRPSNAEEQLKVLNQFIRLL